MFPGAAEAAAATAAAAGELATKIGSSLYERAGKRPDLPLEVRYRVYREFRHSVLRALFALDMWTVVRPGIRGAVWSWPVAVGSFRAYLRNMQEMVVQLAEIGCVGTPEVTTSAVSVTRALVAMNKEVRVPKWNELRRTPLQLSSYPAKRTELLNAVRDFMIVSTADLAKLRTAKASVPLNNSK